VLCLNDASLRLNCVSVFLSRRSSFWRSLSFRVNCFLNALDFSFEFLYLHRDYQRCFARIAWYVFSMTIFGWTEILIRFCDDSLRHWRLFPYNFYKVSMLFLLCGIFYGSRNGKCHNDWGGFSSALPYAVLGIVPACRNCPPRDSKSEHFFPEFLFTFFEIIITLSFHVTRPLTNSAGHSPWQAGCLWGEQSFY
jgi:hypothetical protein